VQLVIETGKPISRWPPPSPPWRALRWWPGSGYVWGVETLS
jgi:hypothetical protein